MAEATIPTRPRQVATVIEAADRTIFCFEVPKTNALA